MKQGACGALLLLLIWEKDTKGNVTITNGKPFFVRRKL